MAAEPRTDDVEVLRRIYAAWNAVDLGLQYFDPEFVLEQTLALFDSEGVFRGHEGLLRAGNELFSEMRDLKWEPDDFVVAPDGRVVVPFRVSAVGRASGARTVMQLVHVWTIRNGLALHCETYEGLDDAVQAVGISG